MFFAIVPLFIGESIPIYVCNPCSFLKDSYPKYCQIFCILHLYGCVVVVCFTTMVINCVITFSCNMAHLNGDSFGIQNFVLRLMREPFTEKLVLNVLDFSIIFKCISVS